MDNVNQQSEWPQGDWPQPIEPQPVEPQPERTLGGVRKVVATLGLSAMLLVAGGAAVVFAASPDPSASPAPAATNPGGTTTPNGGATNPKGNGTHDCPNMGTGGSNRGTNRGTAPAPVTPTTPTTPSATPSV